MRAATCARAVQKILRSRIQCNLPMAAHARMASTDAGHKYGSLFASQAAEYKNFRPTYPPELFNVVLKYASDNGTGSREVVADIACGNGQASTDLAKFFSTVIGVDASPQQVAQAPPAPNMQFMLGAAEASRLDPVSCDLATVAQAMHWFRLPEFYAEMHRILKPKGTLAIWGYPVGRVEGGLPGDAAAQLAKEAFWGGTIGPYWDEKRVLLDNMYEGMDPPLALFSNVQRHVMQMEKEWSLAQLAGYSTTWSAYATYCREKGIIKGSAEDPAVKFLQDLLKAYDTSDVHFMTKVKFPLVLILATKT